MLQDTLTNLDIVFGDACNLRCVHCPHWINESSPRFDSQMLEDRLFEAVSYVVDNCPNFEKAMLIGGEPFVHPGAVSFLMRQRLNTLISVYTNFVWPDPAVELPTNVYFLTSMDAASQEVYGQLRRTKDFAAAQANLAVRSGQLWHVDTTVSRGNLPYLADILRITENWNCTHWFLPVDPRLLRYRNRVHDPATLGTKGERRNTAATARRLEKLLLDESDLGQVKEFFAQHGSARTNDFETFLGIYLSGIDNFKGDDFEYRSGTKVVKPVVSEIRCAGIRRYMEIGFTPAGEYVPMIHCPELWDVQGSDRGPAFATFAEVMDWENDIRRRSSCRIFCGRTQFLGINEYESVFRDVSAGRAER